MFINAAQPMQLLTPATQIDYFPVGTGKRYVKRVIWHPNDEISQGCVSFSTRTKSDMVYDVNQYVANGAEVTDFNLTPYTGDDYSPVYC